ncbi:aminotransferase class I and II [Oscillochloris trichoides DG-6]|uniref:cysteine-S-conjugate beta-lyase n=1 Tax=Oscillochloris trichoides DG-6 TaxID=765420 RepID=E1IB24_9CHLR|nr:PatB family C-S lyase [Oscillochloris trichoides]EFO81670.1 aminotransferase class I and II [Oscillochloris trichoides DG-6]
MSFDFDTIIPRRGTDSMKWAAYPEDVLPMWVADMDFPSPEPVIRALHERAAHGIFGYALPPQELAPTICERMQRLYGWQVAPNEVLFLPGLVTAINVLCRAIGSPGDHVVTLTPAYMPFLSAPLNQGRVCDTFDMTQIDHGDGTLSYRLDLEGFAASLHPQTRLLLMSNPHNPIGMAYDRETLTGLAQICLERGIVFCSDEIHCDLMLDGTPHIPTAALSPEIAANTITLLAPSKTFNVPGLGCGIAIVQNPELRQQLVRTAMGIVPHVTAFGYAGALAAYREGGPWLEAVLAYLSENRNTLRRYLAEHLPQLRSTVPDSTYLAWIDCSQAGIIGSPATFFLERGKVALSDGVTFGANWGNFVRLNFACPRSLLLEGLERMRQALA